MPKSKLYVRIAVNLLVSLIIFLLIILLLPRLLSFFLPFVIAYIISSIANPIVKFMEKKIKILRKHGSAIIIVVSIILILGLLYFIISILAREVISLINDVPSIARKLDELFNELSSSLSKFENNMPIEVKGIANTINKGIEDFLAGFVDGIEMPAVFQTASGYVKSIANGFFLIIVTIIASYFFIADRDKIAGMLKRIFPESFQKGYHMVVDNFKGAVGGYFKAQFKIMLVITLIIWITLQIMGINYAVLIALVTAFIDLLPVFGTGVVFGPWTVVLIVTGDYVKAITLIVLYLVCQFTKQLLQPKMVGDSIGINPMSALIFMFIGYRISGVLGMIIGIPIGMVVINFYRIGAFDRIIKGFKIIFEDIDKFRKF